MKNGLFELLDCKSVSYFEVNYKDKVLVLSPDFIESGLRNEQSQLWLATGGEGCEPGEPKKKLTAIRLSDGETAEFRRGQFYGAIQPRLLPDWAKLKLGRIPVSERAAEWNSYTGYCLLSDGKWEEGVPLADWKDVLDYIQIQKDYQNRIEIAETRNDTIIAYVEGNWCRIDPDVLLTESHKLRHDSLRQEGLKLKDMLLFETIGNVFIAHDTADVGFTSVCPLFNMGEEKRDDYKELLSAEVKAIRPGAYGPEIVLTGIPAQAIINYDRAMSGHDYLIEHSETEQETGPEMSI